MIAVERVVGEIGAGRRRDRCAQRQPLLAGTCLDPHGRAIAPDRARCIDQLALVDARCRGEAQRIGLHRRLEAGAQLRDLIVDLDALMIDAGERERLGAAGDRGRDPADHRDAGPGACPGVERAAEISAGAFVVRQLPRQREQLVLV